MTGLKLIVTGSTGAGKTTVVSAMSEFPPVATNVPLVSPPCGADATTAVALDYGCMTLEDGRRLMIFGTPGQRRHDVMCSTLARGALGVIILLDHAGQDPAGDLHYYMDLFSDTIAANGAVIGVTHVDEKPGMGLAPYHAVLAQRDIVLPVFSVDARSKAHVKVMLEALVAVN